MAGLKAFERQFIRDSVVDEARLLQAKEDAERAGGFSGDAIVKLGFADAPSVYQSLARFCELRFVSLADLALSEALLRKVPPRFATQYRCVPVEEREGVLVLAISDPMNSHLLDDIRLVLKQRLEAVVATPEDIQGAIKRYYGVGADTMERMLDQREGSVSIAPVRRESANLDDDQIDASIIKFVNELILESVKSGATDIHIEPFEDELRVRFRIDGILHQVPAPGRIQGFQAAIVSRVKIMANLNIAEKRLPQDGKILATFGAESYDLRVSILPTPHGETVNMRVLTRSNAFLTLPELGFRQEDLAQFNAFINKPHGILLVTGPTGSGKTTTLYAALSKLNNLERKIITIEDPVEYQLTGVTQMQVHNQIGFDFAMGLRSILRHDPDILLVGEIRDYETAEMAVRSSLTGHLVLSTLHTNDSAGAVTRLLDMGVEPFLISSTMIAAIAQRLLRKNCEACARPVDYDAALLAAEFGDVTAEVSQATFRRGEGCVACRNTGYRGRAAIYEMLPFTPDIKTLTVQRATSLAIKQVALRQGMRTLRRAGWLRACEGATTIEEVLRVTADADVLIFGEGGDAPVSL
ncbi:MAG: type II/IV secretion system protein [Candidatus Hydrogenedentes bacterium]|nr:type II/IV secretion system protein [Candidatus Hydrogenedentota bacterium]